MTTNQANESLSTILSGVLASLSKPPSTSDLRALSLAVGPAMLLAALDLLDNKEVARISLPNGRALYQVAGSSGAYTVHPDVPGGYCPCPAFSHLVLCSDSQVICKHLLAVRLANALNHFVDKTVTLTWLAGLSAKFASAPPAPI